MSSYQGPNLAGLLKARWPTKPMTKAQIRRMRKVVRAIRAMGGK